MIAARPTLERRLLAGLESSPPRIPLLLGCCGAGRTSLLLRLGDHLGRHAAQYLDFERIATTPERFLSAMTGASPFELPAGNGEPPDTREAFDRALAFLSTARSAAGPATFLIDELLEIRTFESFPGLRSALRELMGAIASSPNRFVLATRYVYRAHRLLRDVAPRVEILQLPPMSAAEIAEALPASRAAFGEWDAAGLSRAVLALADGRPAYVGAIIDALAVTRGPADPVAALAELLAAGGRLATGCRFCYELRLHRARGYGALKAILGVLAEEEPLTLTEIARQLHRTPGSTKDYLSWLEDVDLVTVRQKRYAFTDPLLRLWVRLHAGTGPPSDESVGVEVRAYAAARLPRPEPAPAPPAVPALALAGAGKAEEKWGIIEID